MNNPWAYPESNWRDKPPTPKQIDLLTKQGIKIPRTRGEASDRIQDYMDWMDSSIDNDMLYGDGFRD